MPTLIELFKNRQLPSQGGQTAKEAYDIRDANKIQLSSSSPVINGTTIKALNKLRSGNNSPFSETVLEQYMGSIDQIQTELMAAMWEKEGEKDDYMKPDAVATTQKGNVVSLSTRKLLTEESE